MATNNQVNVGLSGSTGSGTLVGSTSAVLVTPTLGAATATSVVFSPTTGGIIGTTTNDNASAGFVGEFISSTVTEASPVSLSSTTAANITSISLTAGNWLVFGNVGINFSATWTNATSWCSLTSATTPNAEFRATIAFTTGNTGPGNVRHVVPMLRVSIAGTTTVYLSAVLVFSTGTAVGYGQIQAIRIR